MERGGSEGGRGSPSLSWHHPPSSCPDGGKLHNPRTKAPLLLSTCPSCINIPFVKMGSSCNTCTQMVPFRDRVLRYHFSVFFNFSCNLFLFWLSFYVFLSFSIFFLCSAFLSSFQFSTFEAFLSVSPLPLMLWLFLSAASVPSSPVFYKFVFLPLFLLNASPFKDFEANNML